MLFDLCILDQNLSGNDAQWLHHRWRLLTTSVISQPLSFYNQLVASIPPENGTNLNHLRVWIATEVKRFENGGLDRWQDVNLAFDDIESQGYEYNREHDD